MAKLTGPLFSLDARGGFAKTVVFSGWKGRKTARFLAIPANPRTEGQEQARSDMTTCARIVRVLYVGSLQVDGASASDRDLLHAQAPADKTWGNHLTSYMLGPQGSNMRSHEAAWTALDAGDRTAWETAAATLSPAIVPAPQTGDGGVFIRNKSAGEILFSYERTLGQMGVRAFDPEAPPTYA
jgi:hypothetical protein